MEIILVKDVLGLGKAGETHTVKGGYARNFLVPSGFGLPATAAHRAQVEARQASLARGNQAQQGKATQLQRTLSETSCTIAVAVGDHGKLHGAVTAGDIVEALKKQGLLLKKHQLQLEKPITQLGVTSVLVKLHPEVTATLKVELVRK